MSNNYDQDKAKEIKCDVNCFHYGMFGGKGCCDPDDWGSMNIPIEPGQKCLYPDKKEFGIEIGVVSGACFCSTLEGGIEGIVVTSDADKKFIEFLTGKK